MEWASQPCLQMVKRWTGGLQLSCWPYDAGIQAYFEDW